MSKKLEWLFCVSDFFLFSLLLQMRLSAKWECGGSSVLSLLVVLFQGIVHNQLLAVGVTVNYNYLLKFWFFFLILLI